MQSPFLVSCVIPFFNEGERVLSVLNVLMQVPGIGQIVCVDDGSKDKTSERIKEKWPWITLVSLPCNEGKSAAIKEGLRWVKFEYVMLMDADLKFLNQKEIKKTIATIQEQPDIDMLILRRITAPWFFKIDRRDVLFSGERMLKTQDLENVFKKEVSGYQLEIAINQYMIQEKKVVRWMPWSASNTHKIIKWGFAFGVKKEISMFREMMEFCGLKEYLRQILVFARKKAA